LFEVVLATHTYKYVSTGIYLGYICVHISRFQVWRVNFSFVLNSGATARIRRVERQLVRGRVGNKHIQIFLRMHVNVRIRKFQFWGINFSLVSLVQQQWRACGVSKDLYTYIEICTFMNIQTFLYI